MLSDEGIKILFNMKIVDKLHLFAYVKGVQNVVSILIILFTLCWNHAGYRVPCYNKIMKDP
jgi:hypothetical protein